ncbi:MAG TPA: PorV/PorQ family protein [Elusimicrobiota bacterium]|nr:PorV/PorQ family protein [Elusimicrobiota bacterium]
MRNLVLLIALLLAAAPLRAAETAAFLNLGVGARYLAMGGAGTALSDDANSLYWNAAGLGAAPREFTVSDMELQQSTRLDFAAFSAPTKAGTFAAGGAYLSQSAIDGRDLSGHATGSFSAADGDVALGYGRKTDLVDMGGSAKLVQSHIGSAQATTFAIDLGARKQIGDVVLGAALRNLGPGMKFDTERNDLPMRLALGAAYKLERGTLAAEVTNAPRAGGTDAGFGGEYQAMKNVFLRAGYTTQTAITGGSSFDAARGLTLGVGFRADRWTIDYAAVPMGELGTTHRFTLGARF